MRIPSRNTVRPILFAALALTLAVAVASATAQESEPAEDVLSIVPPNGDPPIGLSLAEADGRINAPFRIEFLDGEVVDRSIDPSNGAALSDFLRVAGIPRNGYTWGKLTGGGKSTPLSNNMINAGPAAGGSRVPLVYVDNEGIHVLLPLPARAETDYREILAGSSPPRLALESDSLVILKVKPDRRKVDAGEEVTFTVEVVRKGEGDVLEFDWSWGDGSKPKGGRRKRSHTYEEAGRYKATVTATVGGTTSARYSSPAVQVGEPEEGGPDREGGGDNTDEGAGSTGSYSGSGGSSSYDGTSSYDSSSDYTPPEYAPSTSTPTTPPTTSSGPTVEGNLLASVLEPPPPGTGDDDVAAARTGTPVDEPGAGDPAGLPTAVWALGAALGLLTVGAGLESGRPRRLRLRRPRVPRRLPLPRR